MSIKKISLLSAIFFLNLLAGQAVFASEKAPTFIITRNAMTPASINLPALSEITVYFNVHNNSNQSFPGLEVLNLPAGVSTTTDGNTTCVLSSGLAARSTCVLGLNVVGIKQGDDFYIIPEVCDSTGTFCSEPDSNNYVHIHVTPGGGGGSVVISSAENAALVVAEAPLTTDGTTSITVNNLSGSGAATNVTLLTSVLPADYQSAITVDNSDCVTIAASSSCVITITTAAGSTASADSATTIIAGSNTNFTEITLWMGALTVEPNDAQLFQFPSLTFNQTTAYQTAIAGSIDFSGVVLSPNPSTFVEYCPHGGSCQVNSTCQASTAIDDTCNVVVAAKLPTDQDFTADSFTTEVTLSETGVAYAYDSPTDYTLGLYAATIENGIQYWNGTTWTTLIDGGDPSTLLINVVLWNSNLYLGGAFTDLNGVTGATGIATHNGLVVRELDGGVSGSSGSGLVGGIVMVPYVSDLLVGGRFDTVTGLTDVNNLAVWNGTAWSSNVGEGVGVGGTDTVFALLVEGDDIYAGGSFLTAQGATATPANNIALFNGTTWSALIDEFDNEGGGVDGGVKAIVAAEGVIIVGGSFGYVGSGEIGVDEPANNVGIWNPGASTWNSLGESPGGVGTPGDSTDNGVTNLTLYTPFATSELYATGKFTDVNSATDPANNIAYFLVGTNEWFQTDANGLTAPGADYTAASDFSLVWNNVLYVMGCFTQAGTETVSGAASWNGTTWTRLGTLDIETACSALGIANGGMTAASTMVFN